MNVLLCLLLCVLSAPPNDATDPGDGPATITIRGRDYEPYPEDRLRAYGLTPRSIPPEQNAAYVYFEAINALVDPPSSLQAAHDQAVGGTWPEGEAGEQLAAWLEENRAALDLVYQATAMPQYEMPMFRGDVDSIIAAQLPALSSLRQLARLMTIDATQQLHQGNADAALARCLTAQRMGNQVADGHTMIEGLVGIAIGAMAEQTMMRVAEGDVSAEALKDAVAEMDLLAAGLPTFEDLVRAEQTWVQTFAEDVVAHPGLLGFLNGGFPADRPDNGWQRLFTALRRVYLPDRAVKRNLKTYYDTMIEATRQEDGGVGVTVSEEALFAEIPPWDLVTRTMVPSLARVHDLTLRNESNFIRAQLRLAAEAYKRERGSYPPTLGAMTPDHLRQVPVDPMTGFEFPYRASGDGAPEGLGWIDRETETELIEQRKAPLILSPRASRWRRYVQSASERYGFDEAQRTAAESILREMEGRAASFERVHGAKLQQLIEAGERGALSREMTPLDEMYLELKRRVESLPTRRQREAARDASDTAKERS